MTLDQEFDFAITKLEKARAMLEPVMNPFAKDVVPQLNAALAHGDISFLVGFLKSMKGMARVKD